MYSDYSLNFLMIFIVCSTSTSYIGFPAACALVGEGGGGGGGKIKALQGCSIVGDEFSLAILWLACYSQAILVDQFAQLPLCLQAPPTWHTGTWQQEGHPLCVLCY